MSPYIDFISVWAIFRFIVCSRFLFYFIVIIILFYLILFFWFTIDFSALCVALQKPQQFVAFILLFFLFDAHLFRHHERGRRRVRWGGSTDGSNFVFACNYSSAVASFGQHFYLILFLQSTIPLLISTIFHLLFFSRYSRSCCGCCFVFLCFDLVCEHNHVLFTNDHD